MYALPDGYTLALNRVPLTTWTIFYFLALGNIALADGTRRPLLPFPSLRVQSLKLHSPHFQFLACLSICSKLMRKPIYVIGDLSLPLWSSAADNVMIRHFFRTAAKDTELPETGLPIPRLRSYGVLESWYFGQAAEQLAVKATTKRN